MVDIPNEIQDLGFHVQKKLDQSYLPSISYDSYKSIKETAGSRYFHGLSVQIPSPGGLLFHKVKQTHLSAISHIFM